MFDSAPGFGLKSLVRHAGKMSLLKQVNEFNVISDTMIAYLQNRLGNDKQVHNIPGAIFGEFSNKVSLGETMRLVVPGSIDKKRRRYEEVFELARIAENNALTLQVVLLGGSTDEYGNEIIKRANAFQGNSVEIIYFETTEVDQQTYDQELDSSHFIWIPSVIETNICGTIPEVYGVTKSSGNIFDVVRHGKPFIIPHRLMIPTTLEIGCFRYRDLMEIIHFISDLFTEPYKYEELNDQAIKCCKEYNIDNIRKKHPALFL
jgi:hypothetical protein